MTLGLPCDPEEERQTLTTLGERNLQMNKVVPPQLGAVGLLGQPGSD